LAYDLVWGTTAARDRALAALDTIEPNTAWARCLPLGPMAAPPDVMARLQRMFQAVADTSSDPWSTSIAFQQLGLKVLVPRGQLASVQRALAGIERPPGATKWWADDWQIMLHLTGFPDSLAAHDAAGRLVADPYPEARFWLGLLALADRRWADAERLARMLDRQAQDFATSGDTLQGGDPLELAGLARTYAATLRAYSGLLQGDRERLGELEVLLRHFPHAGATAPKSTYLRFQIGRLLFERGQVRDAERYFLSFGPLDYCCTSQAELYLGRINEALGRPQAAAEHYRRFVIWWEHADPALRGPLEEARAALRRL
jgi:hypothetical protein